VEQGISDIVGCLTDPIIVFPGGWGDTIPEWLKTAITLERMNPHNGLCLNALHDKAFDNGLVTITPEYRIRISERLKSPHAFCGKHFLPLDGKKIRLPHRFPPARDFLEYHNKYIFIDKI